MDDVLRIGDYKLITVKAQPKSEMVAAACSALADFGRTAARPEEPLDVLRPCLQVPRERNGRRRADLLSASALATLNLQRNSDRSRKMRTLRIQRSRSRSGGNHQSRGDARQAGGGETAGDDDGTPGGAAKEYGPPNAPQTMIKAACDAMVAAGGFFVPWAEE